jgi:flagellar basal-body rod protein FlgB
MSSTNLLSALESFTSLANQREQTIATNMANVDTPGYHAKDINFDQELQKAMKQADSGLSTASYTPAAVETQGLMERPDGNNVDLDREGMILAQTQLQHEMGVQLIKHHFHNLLSAINGGGQ